MANVGPPYGPQMSCVQTLKTGLATTRPTRLGPITTRPVGPGPPLALFPHCGRTNHDDAADGA
eukprot:1179470-Prorocentrum_minimum.AAC.1